MCLVSCFVYCQFRKRIINLSISIIATSVHPTIINFEWVINFSIFIVETSVPSNEPFVIIVYPEAILNFVWLREISLQNIMYQFHKVVSSTMFILLKHSSRNYFLILIYFFQKVIYGIIFYQHTYNHENYFLELISFVTESEFQ